MKKCSRCKKSKPLSDFKNGICHLCNSCRKKCSKYSNKTDAAKKTKKKFAISDRGKELHRQYSKEYNRQHPEIISAHTIVNHAIRDGKLKKPNKFNCGRCGEQKAQVYHHPDYSRPLEIAPLCKECHRFIHLPAPTNSAAGLPCSGDLVVSE